MFKVTRCERVDNPYYKAFVENPCIRMVTEYPTEAEANAYINGDIDAYLERYPGNDVRMVRIEVPWQVGANLTDHSRFGGLVIMYLKEETPYALEHDPV